MSEQHLKRWDEWRKHIAEGGDASWPRDDFEVMINNFESDISELTEKLAAAEAQIKVLKNIKDCRCVCGFDGPNILCTYHKEEYAKERQAGRNEVLKELSEQTPYCWRAIGGTIWNSKTCEDDVPLIIRPQPPKEKL
jgi:hypothetical protein